MGKLVRLHAVFLAEARQIVHARVAKRFAGQLDVCMLGHQLEQVAVPGDDQHIRALLLSLWRDRADDVVRLVAFHLQDRDVERLHQLADAIDLDAQLVRHLVARALVLVEELVAPGETLVEADGQIFRIFIEDVQQGAREAEAGVGRLAAACGEALDRQGEKLAVGQGMAVDEDEGRACHRRYSSHWGAEQMCDYLLYHYGANEGIESRCEREKSTNRIIDLNNYHS